LPNAANAKDKMVYKINGMATTSVTGDFLTDKWAKENFVTMGDALNNYFKATKNMPRRGMVGNDRY
jgi:hypothetical protein